MGPKVAQRRVVAPSGLWGSAAGQGKVDEPETRVQRSRRSWTDRPRARPGSRPVTCSARLTGAGSHQSRTSTTRPRKCLRASSHDRDQAGRQGAYSHDQTGRRDMSPVSPGELTAREGRFSRMHMAPNFDFRLHAGPVKL